MMLAPDSALARLLYALAWVVPRREAGPAGASRWAAALAGRPLPSAPAVDPPLESGRAEPSTDDAHPVQAHSSDLEQRLVQRASDTLRRAEAALVTVRGMADMEGRPDVGRHVDTARERLTGQQLVVTLIGGSKGGRSSLVNALLGRDLCPVDVDVTTVVPTLVRYGARGAAFARYVRDGPQSADQLAGPIAPSDELSQIPLGQLSDHVSVSGPPSLRRGLRWVEVELPHPLLATGLAVVDMPAVGRPDSPQAAAALSGLRSAAGMLFVTDASRPLSASEVALLGQALERCRSVTCVVTKIDVFPMWPAIAERNRELLQAAGMTIPVLPVSSRWHLDSQQGPDRVRKSGFGRLLSWLEDDVLSLGVGSAARAAVLDVDFARTQLRTEVTTERNVLTGLAAGDRITRRLVEETRRTARLVRSAAWEQAVSDGFQDTATDIDHDLMERSRELLAECEGMIEAADPGQSWEGLGDWLQRQLIGLATATGDLLVQRVDELAEDVAKAFWSESGQPLVLGITPYLDSLRGLQIRPGGTADRMVARVRTGSFAAMAAFGLADVTGGVLLSRSAVRLSVPGSGRHPDGFVDQHRLRQQMKLEARHTVDEAAFMIGKELRESLRRHRQRLRQEFAERAQVLHTTNERALRTAQLAQQLDPAARLDRSARLAEREETLDLLGIELTDLTA